MSIPANTVHIRYYFEVQGGDDFNFHVEVDFTKGASTDPAAIDAAMEAGANAIVASLESQFPSQTVFAFRKYTTVISGDPWPVS